MLKVQPQLESRYLFFAYRYFILKRRLHMNYYLSVEERSGVHNGIDAHHHLTIGAEEAFGVKLLSYRFIRWRK